MVVTPTVCDDPLVANNQRVVNMWEKIRAAYRRNFPHGKDFRAAVGRGGSASGPRSAVFRPCTPTPSASSLVGKMSRTPGG